ncbi:MAG: hypothetical protein ABW133_24620 [Polyangiaceae bacterium]
MTPTEASECVAERFTRVMNATPSPIGPFSDVIAASVVSGVIIVVGFFGVRRGADAPYLVMALAAMPIIVSLVLSAIVKNSREKVVAWLCTVPFPIDNLNTLLAGSGDTIEVVFAPGTELPTRATLQPKLDSISEDVLLVKENAEARAIEIRLGVIDSKRLPMRTNHQRWIRFVEVMEKVIVPLSKGATIERMIVG